VIRVRRSCFTSGQNECQAEDNKQKLLGQHGLDLATGEETTSTKQELGARIEELGERIGVWTRVADRDALGAVNGWDLWGSWDLWGGSLVPSVT